MRTITISKAVAKAFQLTTEQKPTRKWIRFNYESAKRKIKNRERFRLCSSHPISPFFFFSFVRCLVTFRCEKKEEFSLCDKVRRQQRRETCWLTMTMLWCVNNDHLRLQHGANTRLIVPDVAETQLHLIRRNIANYFTWWTFKHVRHFPIMPKSSRFLYRYIACCSNGSSRSLNNMTRCWFIRLNLRHIKMVALWKWKLCRRYSMCIAPIMPQTRTTAAATATVVDDIKVQLYFVIGFNGSTSSQRFNFVCVCVHVCLSKTKDLSIAFDLNLFGFN